MPRIFTDPSSTEPPLKAGYWLMDTCLKTPSEMLLQTLPISSLLSNDSGNVCEEKSFLPIEARNSLPGQPCSKAYLESMKSGLVLSQLRSVHLTDSPTPMHLNSGQDLLLTTNSLPAELNPERLLKPARLPSDGQSVKLVLRFAGLMHGKKLFGND